MPEIYIQQKIIYCITNIYVQIKTYFDLCKLRSGSKEKNQCIR